MKIPASEEVEESNVSDCFIGSPGGNRTYDQRGRDLDHERAATRRHIPCAAGILSDSVVRRGARREPVGEGTL